MSRNRKAACRELIEYRHSYHCFLSKHLPQFVPEPTNFPPPVPLPRPSSAKPTAGAVDLRLLNLDARNWKKQDHYLLLGLHEKRHLATPSEIKTAYRQRVLQYHPDKLQQSSSVEDSVEDNIFKCIFQAYQVLSDQDKRKLYDSVDANAFDDSIPGEEAFKSGDVEDFLNIYRPVFIINARFSRKQPVPDVGHAYSPREDVEAFYGFWSAFESWRTFEYLDEDENDNPENRADKRWMDKKNKANRTKRKNEDNARLRRLFEQAYKLDPRMVRFREDDKLRKDALKMEKEMAALKLAQEKEQEKLKKGEEERLEKERVAQAQLEAKKSKEAAEAAARKVKKTFKKIFIDHLYFVSNKTNVAQMNERSLLLEKYLLRETDLERSLATAQGLFDAGETEGIYFWLEEEYAAKHSEAESLGSPIVRPVDKPTNVKAEAPWSLPEVDTLINAIKTHPGGMRERWARITEWYNRTISHMDKTLPQRTTDEIIKRSNEIKQTTDEGQTVLSTEVQTDYKAMQKKRDPRIDQAEPTTVFDAPGTTEPVPEAPAVWTAEEQKSLQEGLRMYKADDPSRWENISKVVGRSKKECMIRAKEIAQMLKQKKASAA
ncbi:hypothetical protein PSACC_00966 [Paramicrosporidium saccamoebae]|uniref:DnaJ homolog subfamily C member 2 n=1 Tax=Paramicrosporidium saccamoebae TaxID=1246581 RepID=A0A2H9TNB6_9FUNG|nr:hypothetical protein PSACC_00966 [Paramicrosporidium saccamoebae]